MRILLIHQYFLEQNDPGGSRFNEMTKVWIEAGHEVVVICGMLNYVTGNVHSKYKGKKFDVNYYNDKLKVHRTFVSSGYNKNFKGRLWAYFSFVWFGIRAGLKEKEHFDVIIATSPPLFIGVIAWVLSKIKNVKYVFEVRDLWPESAIETGILTSPFIIKLSFWLEKKIYQNAFLINVLTPAFKKILVAKKGVAEKKILMFPNASDFSTSDLAIKNNNSNKITEQLDLNGDFSVIYIGAHGIANDLDQLLDAAKILLNEGVTFVLVGDGMEKKKLVKRAQDEHISNVKFLNPVPKKEVYNYILAADVGISVLKKVDTFKTIYSNKTFDYMACKKAVIMAIDGISRELVEKGACGLFVEPENKRDMANKILMYKNNYELMKKHGENGYLYAKANFDREKLSLDYINSIARNLQNV